MLCPEKKFFLTPQLLDWLEGNILGTITHSKYSTYFSVCLLE